MAKFYSHRQKRQPSSSAFAVDVARIRNNCKLIPDDRHTNIVRRRTEWYCPLCKRKESISNKLASAK